MRSPESHPRAELAAAAIAALIALVWWPALGASFQFDDWNVIVGDARVHSLAQWWASMPGIRPLLKLSYALNWTLSPSPAGLRASNVGCHALAALLLAWLVAVRMRRMGGSAAAAAWAGGIAALLFALHPVQSEAVTYISGRSSLLAGLLCLAALASWVRAEDAGTRTAARGWFAACAALYMLAVASKETAIALPLAAWLYSADRPWRALRGRLALLCLLACALAAAALALPTYRALLHASLGARDVGTNLMTQAHALAYLAGQLLRVAHGNADPQLAVVRSADAGTVLLLALWLALAAGALLNVRRRPAGAFAILWFLLWLAPTNSLLPRLDVANDRQLYLPLAGPAAWLGWRAGTVLAARTRATLPVAALLAVLVVLLATATLERNRSYATELSFWQDTAARNPYNARAANNLGMAWALACDDARAGDEFRRALALDPGDYRARTNLVLLGRGELPGRPDCAAATRQRTPAVR